MYQLVGYVIGRFYDEDVHPRPLVSRAEQLAQQEDEARERRKAERAARYAEKQRAKEGGAAGGQQGAAADGADAAAAAAGQKAAEAMADHTPCNVRFTKAEGGCLLRLQGFWSLMCCMESGLCVVVLQHGCKLGLGLGLADCVH